VVEEALNGRGGLSRVGTNVTNGSHGVPPLFSVQPLGGSLRSLITTGQIWDKRHVASLSQVEGDLECRAHEHKCNAHRCLGTGRYQRNPQTLFRVLELGDRS